MSKNMNDATIVGCIGCLVLVVGSCTVAAVFGVTIGHLLSRLLFP